jgi:hypothetical protein
LFRGSQGQKPHSGKPDSDSVLFDPNISNLDYKRNAVKRFVMKKEVVYNVGAVEYVSCRIYK